MAQNSLSGLIPRGSLGLKLLLVCLLVLAMGVPLLTVGAIVAERQNRATQVTGEIGSRAGGEQVVGGPMLLVPYRRAVEVTDDQNRVQRRTVEGQYIIFAKTGAAETELSVDERRRGIYRAATYGAVTDFHAEFDPAAALSGVDSSYQFDWSGARIVMFVRDSRAIRDAAELRFSDGATATLEPLSDLSINAPQPIDSAPDYSRSSYVDPAPLAGLQAFAAPAPLRGGPTPFTVDTRLSLGGAQRFALAAFAQDTTATIRGDRRDVSVQGFFQSSEAAEPDAEGFSAAWRVPFVARGIEKAADLASFNLGTAAGRDMAVSFVASDDVYRGVMRAVQYGIMFIGIVFLATLIFEAVSGKRAHPAQYILVGLAQCVFYLLLLSITELIGFTPAFALAAGATVLLLAYYAGVSFKSQAVGLRALFALALLYGAMYVLMTLEDFALFAGSVVAFVVIAATMIATRRIDWYGRGAAATTE
ncbi:MAG: cell envelope integrity protein CreD [Hyphomonadaceae bacterium]|nr:cell envelope integrity protein CreD [Hyphomonadaceae bacterium]